MRKIQNLPTQEVHLWCVHKANLDASTLVLTYEQLVSPEERARCDRFRFPADRELFLTTRWLVRTTLSNYVDVDPDDWRFTQNSFGRPEIALADLRSLRFNLSHSRDVALLGVTIARDIGVNIEYTNRSEDTLRIARNQFSSAEISQLEATSGNRQRDLFFAIWTLKEAYIKAKGMGLSLPLKDFTIIPGTQHVATFSTLTTHEDETDKWWMAGYKIAPKYQAAVVVRSSLNAPTKIVFRSRIQGKSTSWKRCAEHISTQQK
jgi:4'-phosphopantetheinyl transferase